MSRWDLSDNPLSHIIYNSFDTAGALADEPARDLIAIYDALTGAELGETLPRPTKDPRQLLRGFERELNHVLREAVQARRLTVERYEVPWPFPELDDEPPSKREYPKNDIEPVFADYPFSM
ncbi:hypothetical protein [Pendulispora albinea]|uniref:Uncharacterized protein n=1 Tax=Pendulispora albinea TaxID=2741071 RepID=A0ABZ2MA73_9BACT